MKFYFTFGQAQAHHDCYHVIEAETAEEAREQMNLRFGRQWAMQYDTPEKAGLERFGLKQLK